MIDEARTLELFGYTSDELGRRSKKPIAVVCEKCGEPRECRNDSYRDLCMSCVQIGKKRTLESRQKQSESTRGEKNHCYGKPKTEAHKQNLSELNSGKNNPHYGKPRSDETRQKISQSENGKIVSDETLQRLSDSHTGLIQSEETRRRRSATQQGVSYDDWESYATGSPYCPKFNEQCKESNRDKYGRRCFLTGVPEAENVNNSGNMSKLSVHHVDMDKGQGCNNTRWKLVPMLMGIHTRMHNMVWEARIEYLLEHVWYLDGVWNPDALC